MRILNCQTCFPSATVARKNCISILRYSMFNYVKKLGPGLRYHRDKAKSLREFGLYAKFRTLMHGVVVIKCFYSYMLVEVR
jgi:hypothetical protein